jgi:hypothetical protein
MKVVLRNQQTGRYYSAAGDWVRRADNALAFDDALSAQDYLRVNCIDGTQPVYRLAPYLIPLLHAHDSQRRHSIWEFWTESRISRWYFERAQQFDRN